MLVHIPELHVREVRQPHCVTGTYSTYRSTHTQSMYLLMMSACWGMGWSHEVREAYAAYTYLSTHPHLRSCVCLLLKPWSLTEVWTPVSGRLCRSIYVPYSVLVVCVATVTNTTTVGWGNGITWDELVDVAWCTCWQVVGMWLSQHLPR